MSKMIKNISNKLGKLELETKNSASKNFYNVPNRGYNPQYKRPPLQILPREAKEQSDQVAHPLYLEGPVDDSTDDIAYELEDSNLAFSNNDEMECPLQEEEEVEADYYCKKFANFMQVHFIRKYDLRSSRKRTRNQDQEEEPPQKEAPAQKESTMKKVADKGKSLLNIPLQSNDQIPSSSNTISPPNVQSVSKEVKSSAENKESKKVIIEKSPPFNL